MQGASPAATQGEISEGSGGEAVEGEALGGTWDGPWSWLQPYPLPSPPLVPSNATAPGLFGFSWDRAGVRGSTLMIPGWHSAERRGLHACIALGVIHFTRGDSIERKKGAQEGA